MREVEKLYKILRKAQEPRDYHFSKDKALELLEGLLMNKARHRYMSCPCRLAIGGREKDKDIICLCIYRDADINEFGSCYCNLYVSKEWNEGKISRTFVPERRPPEKFL